jgi:hypothetical protein
VLKEAGEIIRTWAENRIPTEFISILLMIKEGASFFLLFELKSVYTSDDYRKVALGHDSVTEPRFCISLCPGRF